MKRAFDFPPESDLLALPRLNAASMTTADAQHYEAYEKALTAVYRGSSVRDAAKHHSVRRGTLNDIVAESLRQHPDSKPVGFRACLRHHRRQREPATEAPVAHGPPKSLAAVLALVPAARLLLEGFRGRLPERSRSSRSFDQFFKKFMKIVRDAGWGDLAMWLSPDRGRRAVVRLIRSMRQNLPTPDIDEVPPEQEHATRLEHLFALKPFDRVEADGHRIDVNWHAFVPAPDGSLIPVVITRLWLIVLIDVVSRAILAWNIIVGSAYNRFDVLRTAARSLTPWRRRDLVAPTMRYHPEAWMPNAVDSHGGIIRAACLAIDSAMAHIAKDTTQNLAKFLRGVVNLGFPRLPEGRPYIEAFFRQVEQQIFRLIAGGFRPAGADGEPATATTGLRPQDYPVHLHALDDLMDVAVSGYNPTPQTSLYNRSPRQVIEQFLDAAIPIRSTLTADDVEQLLVLRLRVRISGKKKQRNPFVRWKGAVYRAAGMTGRWNEIGNWFDATVPANDLRRMALWRAGKLFAVLHAQPPWSRTCHDYETRHRANACAKRGLVSFAGIEDAVVAYHDAVRLWASEMRWAADEYVRSDLGSSRTDTKATKGHPRAASILDLTPRRPRS